MKTKDRKSKSGKLAGASILTAIAASLCCITPVLALISGAAGVASSFSWLEPLRPYFVGITVLVLGFAWYQKLKPRTAKEIECACEEDEKIPFMQTKLFLGIVTVFAALMLTLPYYSSVFYPDNKKEVVIVNAYDIETLQLDVEGMTCEACDSHVAYAAQEVEGVIEARADHQTGKAEVKYDKTKTSKEAIIQSINETNYEVVGEELK